MERRIPVLPGVRTCAPFEEAILHSWTGGLVAHPLGWGCACSFRPKPFPLGPHVWEGGGGGGWGREIGPHPCGVRRSGPEGGTAMLAARMAGA